VTALTNPMTTPEDLIVGGASGAPTRLPVGAAGQVLTVHPDTLELVWRNSASGFANPMVAEDDLLIGGTAGTGTRLAKGDDGDVLTVDPVTHHLVWAPSTALTNPMTAANDLIVGGVSGAPDVLAKGASGQVLTVDPGTGDVVWANSASGFANPMVDEGDLIVGGTSGTGERLAAGAAGELLTSDGDGPVWGGAAQIDGYLDLVGIAEPAAPAGGVMRLYAADNTVYAKQPGGTVLDLADGGGGSGDATSLQGEPIDAATPTEGDVLTYTSGEWIGTAPSGGGGGSGASGPLYTPPPALAGWGYYNQGAGGTAIQAADFGGGIALQLPTGQSGNQIRGITQAIPGTTDWDWYCVLTPPQLPQNSQMVGYFLTDGTKASLLGIWASGGPGSTYTVGVHNAATNTSTPSPEAGYTAMMGSWVPIYLRVVHNATGNNRKLQFSVNYGAHWHTVYEETTASPFLTATHHGAFTAPFSATGPMETVVLHWAATLPAWAAGA
jgi:hypothetical protein